MYLNLSIERKHLLLHDFDNEHPFQYVNILSIAYKKRYPVPDLNLSFFLSYFTYFEAKKMAVCSSLALKAYIFPP